MTTQRLATGMLPWLAVAVLWAVAAVAVAADVDAAFDAALPPGIHGLFCAGAIITVITAVFCTGFRAARGPGLKPGQRIISDEDLELFADRLLQRATVEAIVALHGDRCVLSQPPPERLRAV